MYCYLVTWESTIYLQSYGNKSRFISLLSAYSLIISSLFKFHISSCSVASWILWFKFSCVNLLASLSFTIFILLKTLSHSAELLGIVLRIWYTVPGQHAPVLPQKLGKEIMFRAMSLQGEWWRTFARNFSIYCRRFRQFSDLWNYVLGWRTRIYTSATPSERTHTGQVKKNSTRQRLGFEPATFGLIGTLSKHDGSVKDDVLPSTECFIQNKENWSFFYSKSNPNAVLVLNTTPLKVF